MSSFSWVSTSQKRAGVGADLVGQDDRAVGQAAELQLEVYQLYAVLEQEAFSSSFILKE